MLFATQTILKPSVVLVSRGSSFDDHQCLFFFPTGPIFAPVGCSDVLWLETTRTIGLAAHERGMTSAGWAWISDTSVVDIHMLGKDRQERELLESIFHGFMYVVPRNPPGNPRCAQFKADVRQPVSVVPCHLNPTKGAVMAVCE